VLEAGEKGVALEGADGEGGDKRHIGFRENVIPSRARDLPGKVWN
jgi:hypothetical protein